MSTALADPPVGQPLLIHQRDYLSYSALSTYRQCPLKFHFKYVAGLPEETVSSSLVFGGAIHAAIEFWFTERLAGNPEPDLDTLLDVYQSAWRERSLEEVRFGKKEDVNSLGQLAERVLTAFTVSEMARPAGRVIGVEEELRGIVVPGCPELLARFDLVTEEPDAVIVTDFKTSRSRWSREQAESSGEQLLFYHELASSLVPGKDVRLQFAVVTKTKSPVCEIHEVPVDEQAVKRVQRVVERVWAAIEAGVFYPAPSLMNCPSCAFREPCRRWRG